MNSGVPMMLSALPVCLTAVARPRSPIFTRPMVPSMKMLSHLMSRWMIGGVSVCKYSSPLRICEHQLRTTRSFTPCVRCTKPFSVPEVMHSVTTTMRRFRSSNHESYSLMMWSCFSVLSILISWYTFCRSMCGLLILRMPHAISRPFSRSMPLYTFLNAPMPSRVYDWCVCVCVYVCGWVCVGVWGCVCAQWWWVGGGVVYAVVGKARRKLSGKSTKKNHHDNEESSARVVHRNEITRAYPQETAVRTLLLDGFTFF
jgi:hypothetical protein